MRIRPMFLLVALGLTLLSDVRAQCSNGAVTIEKYSPVAYLTLPRISGHQYDVKADLTVAADGSIAPTNWAVLRLDGTVAEETKDPTGWFLQPVQDAMGTWKLVNETGKDLSVHLSVEFRLLQEWTYGDFQRNLVILKDDELRIKVIAKRRYGAMP